MRFVVSGYQFHEEFLFIRGTWVSYPQHTSSWRRPELSIRMLISNWYINLNFFEITDHFKESFKHFFNPWRYPFNFDLRLLSYKLTKYCTLEKIFLSPAAQTLSWMLSLLQMLKFLCVFILRLSRCSFCTINMKLQLTFFNN